MELVGAADAALERGDWPAARAAYERALAVDPVPHAWEGLGWAAWWLSDEALTLSAQEQAFHGYRAAGDPRSAARAATWLASSFLNLRGDDAVARGWLERARRLLDGFGAVVEQGYLRIVECDILLTTHQEPAEAERVAADALHIGRALGAADVEAVALAQLGNAAIRQGQVQDGLRLLDEASAMAAGDHFDVAMSPGWTLCSTIKGCETAGDFSRAAQWARALAATRWNGRHFTALCRGAYGQVLTARGEWAAADAELTAAVDEILAARPAMSGGVLVKLGELRARQGRVAEARALFEQAGSLPDAVLALGALALDQGDAQVAVDAAERVLRRVPAGAVPERLRACSLLAVARAALGEHDAADVACANATSAAEQMGTVYLHAQAQLTRARVAHARGDHEDARRSCEDAVDLFGAASAPYEQASARELLAGVLRALGRPGAADREASAARRVLAELGAAAGSPHELLTARELDVLRRVARGLSNAAVAEELVLSPHTVHRHMANIRAKLGLSSRAAVAAYAVRENLV